MVIFTTSTTVKTGELYSSKKIPDKKENVLDKNTNKLYNSQRSIRMFNLVNTNSIYIFYSTTRIGPKY